MCFEIKAGDKFKHFKGTVYTVVAIARHTETEESLVVYADPQGNTWARPLEMFCSLIDKDKYPQITQKYRFEKIEDLK